MAEINKQDNLNQGLPNQTGLDETARARLQRQLDGGDGGVRVGSFRDLQIGLTDVPVEERPLNPNQDEEGVVSIAEQDAAVGVETQATQEAGIEVAGAGGESNYDDMTKEELQAEAESRGLPTSGTKDEIRARLEGQ